MLGSSVDRLCGVVAVTAAILLRPATLLVCGETTKFGAVDAAVGAHSSWPSTMRDSGTSVVGKLNVVLLASGKKAMPPLNSSCSHTLLGWSWKEHG